MFPFLKGTAAAGLGLLLAVTIPAELPTPPALPLGGRAAQEIGKAPEWPRASVDVGDVPASSRTIRVPAGGDLQAVLDRATGGDLIVLEPGATYQGPLVLRPKETEGWIVIASGAAGRALPAPGRRVDRSHAPLMPKLVASSGPVIQVGPGAHHYRFVGLEIAPAQGTFLRELVQLGVEETNVAALPHHIVIDRCYLHGDPKQGTRRGIALNSRQTAVVDSYLADFKEVGADSQAIAGWNGAGPFRIANNYLEAAGENIMFGGADPKIPDLVPADIEIVHNHLTKPLGWREKDERFQGVAWTVKNLFELKNARRVLVDGNLFEYNWPHGQNGFAILFTPRNQDGRSPWSTVEDVIFSNNLVRHVGAGINMLGHDDNYPSQRARRIVIRNNLFQDVGGSWGNGRLFQLLDGMIDVAIDHNTAFQTDSIVYGGDHAPHAGFVFQNNIVLHNDRGIVATGTQMGTPTLDHYFPGAVVRRNLIVGGRAELYPPDNFFPQSLEEIGFVEHNGRQPRLSLARRYARAGTDGHDPGADIATLTKAMTGITTVTIRELPPSRAGTVNAASIDIPIPRVAPRPVFWVALLLLGYIYLGYPIVARLRAILRPRPRCRRAIEPSVSVVVIAHNEEDRIAARIENLLALDYPHDRLEIVVGSDGSTDRTVDRARHYEPLGVRVHAFRQRRGKPAVLNLLVPKARGDVVVFADARQRFDTGALRALVANFADPSTGAVSGELVLLDRGTRAAGQGAAFYWRYEKLIRSTESRSGSTVGATGAIYAIRRELFAPIPEDTILDDVLIPVRIVRQGFRVLFEPEARAYDTVSATARQEFARKTRTIAGTFQLFAREPWLLNPMCNPLWFETVSHKALRLAVPALHAALFASNLALTDGTLYRCALAAQVAFYVAAFVGSLQRDARGRSIVTSVPYAMCLLCWATVVGFARFATNRQQVTWERVAPRRAHS